MYSSLFKQLEQARSDQESEDINRRISQRMFMALALNTSGNTGSAGRKHMQLNSSQAPLPCCKSLVTVVCNYILLRERSMRALIMECSVVLQFLTFKAGGRRLDGLGVFFCP